MTILSYSCKQEQEQKDKDTSYRTLTNNRFEEKQSDVAISIINPTIHHALAYLSIEYPNGDVPKNSGVCTDVTISTYKTGEIVTWMINKKLLHIGIVTNKKSRDGKRNLIVHNVGGGQVMEECLFKYNTIDHYK